MKKIIDGLRFGEGTSASAFTPDGICLDEEGAVWVADPLGMRVIRVREGGEVLEEHKFSHTIPFACVLGGLDRKTLLVCTAGDYKREGLMKDFTGEIYKLQVSVAGVGKP